MIIIEEIFLSYNQKVISEIFYKKKFILIRKIFNRKLIQYDI
jgi:hypothetical protein